MNSQHKLKQDWFRLKLGETKDAGRKPNRQGPTLTSPTDAPVNHSGMDLSQLPPMREALLTAEQIASLFSDIEEFGTQISLMHNATLSGESHQQMNQVLQLLVRDEISRVQIRYHWQGALWIDTLQRSEKQFRLIRIMHER